MQSSSRRFCMRRLIYKMDSPCALQIGLSDADKQWLDAHSLDDLRLEFRRASFKPRRRSCTSNFRGVCLVGKMYIAQLTSTVGGQFKFLFRKSTPLKGKLRTPGTAPRCSIVAGTPCIRLSADDT